ncbi:Cardiolipin synthetase [Salisediminibacterium beveridgei]|uniref:Cardiolipin synthetase n=2 Tax=Salisediminibacterium beveridgei TaxID=632773 RepID=A0A1D7QZE4_9BACI|nr:Cardiolipin synthetase [Salisediminibacterium beveridgei]
MKRAAWVMVVFILSSGTLLFGMVDPPGKTGASGGVPKPVPEDGYQAMLVEEREKAGQIRLDLLRQADEEMQIVYHTFHSGDWMKAFFSEVLAAADRGVEVTILVDGLMNQMRGEMRGLPALLAGHEQIDLHYYKPPRAGNPAEWNNRLHDKLIVIDQTYVMTGGRNIGDKYFSPPDEPGVSDRDVLVKVTGDEPEQSALMSDLNDYLANLTAYKGMYSYKEETSRFVERRAKELEKELMSFESPAGSGSMAELDFLDVDHVAFMHNPFGEIQNEPFLWEVLTDLAHHAEDEILVQTPYLVLNEPMQNMLEAGEFAPEQVTVLTNSLYSSPNFPAFSAYLADRDRFAASEVQLFEYGKAEPIHAKTFLFDGYKSVIGSYNVDPRSVYLNTESLFVIEGETFAEELQGSLDAIETDSIQVQHEEEHFQEKVPVWKDRVMTGLSRITSRLAHLL